MKTQIIRDEILEKLSLENIYTFLNSNLMMFLSDEEMGWLQEVQQFCTEFERKHDHEEDLYKWFPEFGKQGLISRARPWRDFKPNGFTVDILRIFAIEAFDCQFDMAIGASALAINPIAEHHAGHEASLRLLDCMLEGSKIGCICITEPEQGSDAVNMKTRAEKTPDGTVVNGIKCYNTNSPASDIAVLYAVYDTEDPRRTMIQGWAPSSEYRTERIKIDAVPRIYIGKTIFEDTHIPHDQILGDDGAGYSNLFEGLVPERLGIVAASLGQCWGSLATAVIYADMRKQFGTEILKHQGVGFQLGHLHSEITTMTLAMLNLTRLYDEKGEMINENPLFQQYFVAVASQLKYKAAKLAHEVAYEGSQTMGGAGLTDNTRMRDLMGISTITETVGGTRNIQLLLAQRALHQLFKML